MLVCKCEPVPTCHPQYGENDVEEVECGAAGSAKSETLPVHDTPATPRPPPRPLTRPCPCHAIAKSKIPECV
eukprot:1703567-Prymnesium_polylepis.1